MISLPEKSRETYLSSLSLFSVKVNSLFYFAYWALQPALFYVFWNLGHDTDEYVDLFSKANSYLEPFWYVISLIFSLAHIDKPVIMAGSLVMLLSIGGFLLLKAALNTRCRTFGSLLILATILSYQISFVTGALRQGISVMYISVYLLTMATMPFIVGVMAHWSGAIYLLLKRRLYPALFIFICVGIYYGYDRAAYLESAIIRVTAYLDRMQDMDAQALIVLSLNKIIYLGLLSISYERLRERFSQSLIISIYAAVMIQLAILLISRSEVIFQRAGMIFDPFVIVGTIALAIIGNRLTAGVLFALIFLKLGARIFVAIQ